MLSFLFEIFKHIFMMIAFKGYYENGEIFLNEAVPVTVKTEVIIVFLSDDDEQITGKRIPGGLSEMGTIPDDFNEPLEDLQDYM
jgi:hypothetical protein